MAYQQVQASHIQAGVQFAIATWALIARFCCLAAFKEVVKAWRLRCLCIIFTLHWLCVQPVGMCLQQNISTAQDDKSMSWAISEPVFNDNPDDQMPDYTYSQLTIATAAHMLSAT